MALKAPTSYASSNRAAQNRVAQPNLEPGTYPARVVRVIDLGVQPQRPFPGDPKPKAPIQTISITYELVDVFMLDEDGNDIEDKPRWISEEFPLHALSADLAKSTKRYNAIDPEEEHAGDWSQLLGSACMVTTVQKESKGKTYDNIGNVTQARARDAARMPELKNPASFFDMDNPDLELFNSFPPFVKEKIQSGVTYAGSPLERALGGGQAPAKKAPAKASKPVAEPAEDEGTEDLPW